MLAKSLFFVVVCWSLTACGSGPEIVCKMPTLPGQSATETEWSLYKADMEAYSKCMEVKARSGAHAALDKVESAADQTKSLVNKARSHL